MNLLANTTICAESCEIKLWNFKALHNPALYIHCSYFPILIHIDFMIQLTRPIAYMNLVQCTYTALSKCWKIAGKSLHLIDRLFHQFKEVSNASVKTYFTRITLTAFTTKINWSYQWMKEKWYKEQLHLARDVSDLQKHPFFSWFLRHSPWYLTPQSMLYPHLVLVSLYIQ